MSYAIGIDFGSTSSCVAVVRNGVVETIPNDMGNRQTPSAVGFNETEELVGDPAMNQFAKNAKNTVINAKRLLGQKFDSEYVQEDIEEGYFASEVVANENNDPVFSVSFRGEEAQFSAEEITTMVLAKMRENAEKFLSTEVNQAVIGIPHYFKAAEREALQRAAKNAGLEVLRFVHEASATAMAYNFDVAEKKEEDKKEKVVVVFDYGGTSLNTALLTVDEKGMFSMKSSRADPGQGGEKLTKVILDEFARKDFKRKMRTAGGGLKAGDLGEKTKAALRLLRECASAKHTLSASAQAPIEVELLAADKDYSGTISRERFDELTEEQISEAIEILDELFEDDEESGNTHGIVKHDVTDVVIVGGSAKIPNVQRLVRNYFAGCVSPTSGTLKQDTIRIHGGLADVEKGVANAVLQDESVALGAAIQADLLWRNRMNDNKRILKQLKEAAAAEEGVETPGDSAPTTPKNTTPKSAGSQAKNAVNLTLCAQVAQSSVGQSEKLAISAAKCVQKSTLALTLGVADETGKFVPMLKRGHAVPCTARKVFKAAAGASYIQVLEGESANAAENKPLAKLQADAEKGVQVELSVTEEGLLVVRVENKVVVKVARAGTEKTVKESEGEVSISFAAPSGRSDVEAVIKASGKSRGAQEINVKEYLLVQGLTQVYERIHATFQEQAQQGQEFTEEKQKILAAAHAAVDAAHNEELQGQAIKDKVAELQAMTAEFCYW